MSEIFMQTKNHEPSVSEVIQNLSVEKTLIGACLRSPSNIYEVADGVKEEDFFSLKHRATFKAIKTLREKNAPVDHLSVSNQTRIDGREVLVSELVDMEESYFIGYDLEYYKAQLKELSNRRKLLCFVTHSVEEIQDASIEYPDLEGRIFKGVMEILNRGKDREVKTSDSLLKNVIDEYYQRKIEREQGKKFFGISTGFKSLDSTLGGLQEGTLGVVAGRQHHGKSTVAMDIVRSAIWAGFPSLYTSLEQPASEILLYLIQKETGIKPLRIKSGDLLPWEEKKLTQEFYSGFKKLPIFFEDSTRTLHEVLMKIRRMVFSYKVRFVVVDYLQLIENPVKGEARHIEVAGISRALKRLAMDLNISILALSQLNKSPEERESKRIYLSDMRESEAISQDADYVIFIHRPILMGKEDTDHLELAKNRHGETIPRINVVFDRSRNTYRETTGNGGNRNG